MTAPVDTAPPPIDDANSFPLTTPIVLAQLESEILSQIDPSTDLVCVIVGPDDFSSDISTSNPAVLWVSPASIAESIITSTITDHAPDANWGLPQVLADFNTIYASFAADPEMTLSDADKDRLLRGLVMIVMANQGGTP